LMSTCKAVFQWLTTLHFPTYRVPIPSSTLEAEVAPTRSNTFMASTNVTDDADTARPNLQPCSLLLLLRSGRCALALGDGARVSSPVEDTELLLTRRCCWSLFVTPRLADVDKWLAVLPSRSQLSHCFQAQRTNLDAGICCSSKSKEPCLG
jgi:hypothetical protein